MMKNTKLLLILPVILLLGGCGVKKQEKMNLLSKGMHKGQVRTDFGKPETTRITKNSKGEDVEIWEYNLAEVDKNQRSKRITVGVVGGLFFWPALFALPAMDSAYTYDSYFVEFQNDHVNRWGRSIDLGVGQLA